MTKKTTLPIILAFILIFSGWPFFKADARSNESYRYLKTETGTAVRHVHRHVHEVVNPRTNFSANDSVAALTQISNISGINTFQFRYDLYGLDNNRQQTVYSNTFYPNYQNWPETISSWNYFDRLPDGRYEFKVSISLNSGSYRLLDTERFDVGTPKPHYPPVYQPPHQPRPGYPYGRINYDYNYTHTGLNIRHTGNHAYEIVGGKTNFSVNEDVNALTKLSNIYGIDRFRVSYEVYQDGHKFYRRVDAGEQFPRLASWNYNFSHANIGKLPAGSHELRTYITIDGAGYTLLDRKTITVGSVKPAYFDYRYNWTQSDIRVRHVSGYIYDVTSPKSTFTTDESVFALTKISEIRNVEHFRIKHELMRGNSVYRTSESPVRRPNYAYWEYNYFHSDFGRLPAGSYRIRVHITINGGAYKLLDTKNITVEDRRPVADYRYDWTETGSYQDYAYAPSQYPPYYSPEHPYYYSRTGHSY